MTVARQIIGVGRAHSPDQELVANRPVVDEEILAERIGARERRQRGKTFDPDLFALSRYLTRMGAKIGAKDIAEPRQAASRARQRSRKMQRRPLAGQRERDVGPTHGEAAYHLAHCLSLSPIAFEEFEPGWRGIE